MKEKKNKKIIVLVGVSCSGKSTWAANFIKENPDYKVISRDTIREKLFGLKDYDYFNNVNENIVTEVFNQTAHSLLKHYNLIFDNTHLRTKYINSHVKEFGYLADIEIKQFPLIEYRDLCERNNKRLVETPEKFIPWDSLNHQLKQYNDFNIEHIENISKDNIITKSRWKFKNEFNDELEYCYIFDIDGTLSESTHRSPYSTNDTEVFNDRRILNVSTVLNCINHHYKILFLSGREEKLRTITLQWLEHKVCSVKHNDLFMRATDDHRPDFVIKKELYENNIKDKYNVLGVFDDRKQVIDMWNKEGLFVFDVGQNKNRF